MKKNYLWLVMAIMPTFLSGCGGNDDQNTLKNGSTFKVLHLNDTHGAIEEQVVGQATEPGMGKIAGYVAKVRKDNPNRTVLLSSGDMFQGSMDSNSSRGKIMIDIMKEMQFDAMAIGNHEFDWGAEVLLENKLYAENLEIGDWSIPFLSGNIILEGENVLGELSTTFTRGGATISIIGAIDPVVKNSIDAGQIGDYVFQNPQDMVIAEAQRLRETGSDIILYTTHYSEGYMLEGIANYVDCIFTGHQHKDYVNSITNENNKVIPIIESGSNGKTIGEVTFKYQKSSDSFIIKDYDNIHEIEKKINKSDEGIQEIYDYYLDEIPFEDGEVTADSLRDAKTKTIGKITSNSNYANGTQVTQSNALKLFNDVQLLIFHDIDPLVVASSFNGARSPLPVGNITYSDIYKAFPFDNVTTIIELKGNNLINWSTSLKLIAGLTINTIREEDTYRLVTSTYVLNNLENYNYQRIVTEYPGVFQRQVLYRAFLNHPTHTPVG